MKHKVEPWSYEPDRRGTCAELMDSNGNAIGAGDYDGVVSFKLPDARRIVACVNACRGIGTETLERFDKEHAPENGFGVHRESKLEYERDTYRDLCGELLKQLKDAQDTLAHCKADVGYSNRQYKTAVAMHCAITKAEAIMGENSNG